MRFSMGLLLCASVLMAPSLSAWGSKGHRIAARIAELQLSPEVRTAAVEMLEGRSFVKVSTIADEQRIDRPETREWHFVDIPLGSKYDGTRDCAVDCAVSAIDRLQRILADRTRTPPERENALIFLIHLIADIHQPLHVANNGQRAGTDIIVRFGAKTTNVHAMWDTNILNADERSAEEIAEHLFAECQQRDCLNDRLEGTVVDWVNESHEVAARTAYAVPEDHIYGPRTVAKIRPVIDDQLLRAGLRLARLLEGALAGTP